MTKKILKGTVTSAKNNKFKEGQKVSIIERKPFSKKKTWLVIEK